MSSEGVITRCFDCNLFITTDGFANKSWRDRHRYAGVDIRTSFIWVRMVPGEQSIQHPQPS